MYVGMHVYLMHVCVCMCVCMYECAETCTLYWWKARTWGEGWCWWVQIIPS